MEIPISCGACRYGYTFDLSVDDLCTYCTATGDTRDWCDFPHREDKTYRMWSCPLPEMTRLQYERAMKEKSIGKHILKLKNKMMHGKTKLIKKRNRRRFWEELCKVRCPSRFLQF